MYTTTKTTYFSLEGNERYHIVKHEESSGLRAHCGTWYPESMCNVLPMGTMPDRPICRECDRIGTSKPRAEKKVRWIEGKGDDQDISRNKTKGQDIEDLQGSLFLPD